MTRLQDGNYDFFTWLIIFLVAMPGMETRVLAAAGILGVFRKPFDIRYFLSFQQRFRDLFFERMLFRYFECIK